MKLTFNDFFRLSCNVGRWFFSYITEVTFCISYLTYQKPSGLQNPDQSSDNWSMEFLKLVWQDLDIW